MPRPAASRPSSVSVRGAVPDLRAPERNTKKVIEAMMKVSAKATVAALPSAVTPGVAMLSMDSGTCALPLKADQAMAPLITPLISAPGSD